MTEITQTALSTQRSVHISNAHPRLPYKATLFLFVFSLSFLFISCSHNPVGPGEILTPGRRDYVWTVDTINIPNTQIFRFGGHNANHFWIWGTGDNELIEVTNGTYRIRKYPGVFDISCITDYDSTRVRIGTATGKVFKMVNNTFVLEHEIVLSNNAQFIIYDIAEYQNELLLLGSIYENGSFHGGAFVVKNGVGKQIKYDTTDSISNYLYIRSNSISSLIVTSTYHKIIDSVSVYKKINEELELVLRKSYQDNEYISVYSCGNELYLLVGWELYKYNDSKMIKITTCETKYEPFLAINNEKDIFAYNQDGIAHYNGENWKPLLKISGVNLRISSGALFKEKVLFIAHDYGTNQNYLIQGKLQ